MRTICFNFFFAALISLIANSTVHAGDGVGNGGDKVKTLFFDARLKAIEFLNRIKSCAIPGTIEKEVRYWLIDNNVDDVLADVKNSPHEFQKDPAQITCAETGRKRNSKIIFSMANCGPKNYTLAEATRLIIHESIHHFDLKDEDFTEKITSAILESGRIRKGACLPLDVFDPKSCQGKSLTNADFVNLKNDILGRFDTYVQYRDCNRDGKCENGWTEWKPADLRLFNQLRVGVNVPLTGFITFFEVNPGQFALRTVGAGTACLVESSSCALAHGPNPDDIFYPFEEDLNQPFKVTQKLTKKCLRQAAFFNIFEDGIKKQYQFVITSQF